MSYELGDDFDFKGQSDKLLLVGQFLTSIDLNGIVSLVDTTHGLAPMLDPTAYRDALHRGDMDAIRDFARALQPAMKVWDERIAPKVPA